MVVAEKIGYESGSIMKLSTKLMLPVLLVGLLSLGPLIKSAVTARADVQAKRLSVNVPHSSGIWTRHDQGSNEYQPKMHGSESHVYYYQSTKNQEIKLTIDFYPLQTQGKELIHVENSLFDKTKWSINSSKTITIESHGVSALFKEDQINARADRQRLVVISYYLVANEIIVSRLKAKLLDVSNYIMPNRGAMVVTVSQVVQDSYQESSASLLDFLQHNIDDISISANI